MSDMGDAPNESERTSASAGAPARSGSGDDQWKRKLVIAVVTAVAAAVAGAVVAGVFDLLGGVGAPVIERSGDPEPEPPPPTGTIEYARARGVAEIEVGVRLEAIPTDHHVWLAVQVGDLLWPRKGVPANAVRWSTTVYDETPRENLRVVLLLVDDPGNTTLEGWLARGEASGDWPGVSADEIPGAISLDTSAVSTTPE